MERDARLLVSARVSQWSVTPASLSGVWRARLSVERGVRRLLVCCVSLSFDALNAMIIYANANV